MHDNAGEHDCLFDVWLSTYKADSRKESGAERSVALRFILAKNILCDDALTMLRVGVGPTSGISSRARSPSAKDYRLGQLMQGQGQHGITLNMLDWEEDAGTGGY